MKKKNLLLVIVLVSVLLFSSCYAPGADTEPVYNYDNYKFYANRKNELTLDAGRKSCVYGGRVYYLSAESGKQGIHSMNPDGSDVKLEMEVEDVRKIQITEDEIYYAGHAETKEYAQKPYRVFDLMKYSKKDNTTENMLDLQRNILDESTTFYYDHNIWDFYMTSSDILMFSTVGHPPGDSPFGLLRVYLSDGEELIKRENMQCFEDGETLESFLGLDVYKLVNYENLIFNIAPSGHADTYCVDVGGPIAMWEETKEWSVSGEDPLFGDNALIIYGIENNEISLLLKNRFTNESYYVTYSIDNGEINQIFKTNHIIKSLIDQGEYGYVETDKKEIYRIEYESGECKKIAGYRNEDVILHMDKEKVVVAEEDGIHVYQMEEGKEGLEEIGYYEMEQGYRSESGKTDVAGDYLFLYYFNEETNRDELKEKINLSTEERIRL